MTCKQNWNLTLKSDLTGVWAGSLARLSLIPVYKNASVVTLTEVLHWNFVTWHS